MKQFQTPEIWVSTFDVEDIITLSGGNGSWDDSGAIGSGGAWEDELPR